MAFILKILENEANCYYYFKLGFIEKVMYAFGKKIKCYEGA